ncbi:venom allergen 5-like [Amphibalanus amphitrite]|uniref:venom allergen 5-like n=1 Tax=Amphibalanus amphitrite TaxID=1232801 RepID=UPI001C905F71|nr:venom allergen 5-like [Amphibalanus amphitrite]XP_043204805.1 venom allergen 5-like [Amphibalanus amphitrite]XP_043204806.1 venom allergen 5-like [Amphibalanus amphitrite]
MARPTSLLALLMPALCALAQMDNRQRQELLQQSRMQQQLFRVLPDHLQPKFDSDDGGDHYPARTSDHYCRLFGGHSLCQVPHTRQSCGFVRRRRLSVDESAAILHRHNMERMLVAQGRRRGRNGELLPSGANIMQLRYDVELHDVAQGAADRCVDGHDCHECRQVARGHVGQNVAQRSFSMGRGPLSRQQLLRVNLRPLDAMGGWLEELTRLGSSDVHSLSGGTGAGHYTQVIWATTEMLGCGWIEHAERGGLSFRLYCNYAPHGNSIGKQVYQAGEPCSACPQGTTCSTEYPGLCKRL